MKFLRSITEYIKADRIQNSNIWNELNVEPLEENIGHKTNLENTPPDTH